jgi:hypothetical protein
VVLVAVGKERWRNFGQYFESININVLPCPCNVLLDLEDHGDFSDRLRCDQATASSVRATLRGDAGWHRADFADARTLDDGRVYDGSLDGARVAGRGDPSVHVVVDLAALGQTFSSVFFYFFSSEAGISFWFLQKARMN